MDDLGCHQLSPDQEGPNSPLQMTRRFYVFFALLFYVMLGLLFCEGCLGNFYHVLVNGMWRVSSAVFVKKIT